MKKIKSYKNLTLTIFIMIAALIIYSCKIIPNNDTGNTNTSELKLTVKSNDPSTNIVFDACLISDIYDQDRKDLLNQTTPFEMSLKSDKVNILLKKVSGNSEAIYSVVCKDGSISASWPISVILINGSEMQTFGL